MGSRIPFFMKNGFRENDEGPTGC